MGLQLAVTSNDGRNASCRLIPTMAASGFIINPSLLTDEDLKTIAQGDISNTNVSFAVRIAPSDRKFFGT